MKIVIFGLTVSSSWGNGHAALWRGLIAALLRQGHRVRFFERDVPYYADEPRPARAAGRRRARALSRLGQRLAGSAPRARREPTSAMVTSYCPDGIAATALVLDSRVPVRCFYDLDTPVTLARLERGRERGLYRPGRARAASTWCSATPAAARSTALRDRLGARRAVPLYGWVDPDMHRPAPPQPHYAGAALLSRHLCGGPAGARSRRCSSSRRGGCPQARFVIGGAQYPQDFPWTDNIYFVRHLPPPEHPAFYCSSRADAERDARGDGAHGLVPVRPAVRGGGVRRADPERLVGGARRVLRARPRDPGRARHRGCAGRARPCDAESCARSAARARERMLAEHTAAHRARTHGRRLRRVRHHAQEA